MLLSLEPSRLTNGNILKLSPFNNLARFFQGLVKRAINQSTDNEKLSKRMMNALRVEVKINGVSYSTLFNRS